MPFVKCDATSIHYETAGSGAPLVLVHGWGAACGMWAEQMEVLSRQYTVIVYDQRGHGKSTKPPRGDTYSIERFADDLESVLDALGHRSVRLLGHSMGGNVALSYALAHPDRVEKLVLASTFARRSISAWESLQLNIARLLPLALIARPFVASCMSRPDAKLINRVVGYYRDAGKSVLLKSARAIGNVDYRARLGEVRCPTLILYGDNDKAVSPENTKALVEGIPGAKLHVLKGGGHAVNWENADEFNRVVMDFLSG